MRIGIIGGGASGLTAAITAKRANKNAKVFILEHKDMLGKKILSTGNGRCNLTNKQMTSACFRSEQMQLVEQILGQFGTEDTLHFFDSLGVATKSREGYIYPRSNQAATVRDALLAEICYLDIAVYTNTHVCEVCYQSNVFRITCEKKNYSAEKVILATGGKAASILGSDGSGYFMSKKLGHSIHMIVPALVQLKVANHPFAKAVGVRTDAKVTALVQGRVAAEDVGEVQITAYGISGIPVFQISRYLAKAIACGQRAEVAMDVLPELSKQAVYRYMQDKASKKGHMDMHLFLEGLFPKKLVLPLLRQARIQADTKVSALNEKQLHHLGDVCKKMVLTIVDTNGFEQAQVCAGGVDLTELCPRTMESHLHSGLYLTGEVVDVDGICGGYNLQWAWATGVLAGTHAATNKEYKR